MARKWKRWRRPAWKRWLASPGIGVPAMLGIPVTHRDFSHGGTLVAGHTRDGKPLEWQALARSGTTLVIYTAWPICRRSWPDCAVQAWQAAPRVAVVQNGTLARRRSLVTRLGEAVGAVAKAVLGSPAIVAVGELVRLAAVETSGNSA